MVNDRLTVTEKGVSTAETNCPSMKQKLNIPPNLSITLSSRCPDASPQKGQRGMIKLLVIVEGALSKWICYGE